MNWLVVLVLVLLAVWPLLRRPARRRCGHATQAEGDAPVTRLRLVPPVDASPKVERLGRILDEVPEAEQILRRIVTPAREAARELLDALTSADRDQTIAALKRLSSIGVLATVEYQRLEGRL